MSFAFAICFALLGAIVVAAGFIVQRGLWDWCPRCAYWHNRRGDRCQYVPHPASGFLSYRKVVCHRCRCRE